MEETNEEWRPIPGYEGLYEVSNFRRVRSVARTEQIGGSVRPRAGTVLRLDHGRAMLSKGGAQRRLSVNRIADAVFADKPDREPDLPGEIWKAIPGFGDLYEISNHLRVRTIARQIADGRYRKARLLRPYMINGYSVVSVGSDGEKIYLEKTVFELFPETAEAPTTMAGEEWKDISGYEGFYKISNFGRVFSTDRVINGGHPATTRYIRSRLREHGADGGGYPKVELARDGKTETVLIHRLVAEAFVPNPLGLPVVHHRDENRLNPRADNLEWVTTQTNISDWFDRRRVVITTDTIDAIVAARAAGKSQAEILASLPKKRRTKP